MTLKSLPIAYFSLGAFALISQTVILREFFVVVYGNEFIFGVLLFNWLVGIFAGAVLGGIWAGKSRNIERLFMSALLLLALLLPLAVTAVRMLYPISGTPAGTYIGFGNVFLYSALMIIPISFFIGFSFPVAARLHTAGSHRIDGQVQKVSHIYIYEALGSLVGGLIYTFVLVGNCSPYFIVFLAALPLPLSGLLLMRRHRRRKRVIACILLFTLILIGLTPYVNQKIETITVAYRWRSFSSLPLTASLDSRYQNIAVARLGDQYNLYLNTMFAAAFPDDSQNMMLAAHLIAQHPAPKRILIIGDAVGGVAKHLLQYDIRELHSVEIDGRVVDTIYKYLPLKDKETLTRDKRFQVHILDGRKYVNDLVAQGKRKTVDLVYLNIPEPSTLLLNRYYTVEFFRDISRILTPGGVLAFKLTASENYRGGVVGDYAATIYNTLNTVFPFIVAVPDGHSMLFASQNPHSVSGDPTVLTKRHREAAPRTDVPMHLYFKSLYPPEKTAAFEKALRDNPRHKINTDKIPVAGFFYNKIIGWYGKSRLTGLLEFFETIRLNSLVGLLIIGFLGRLLYCFARRAPGQTHRRIAFHVLLAVFSAGMAGLSLELVILYIFQNHFGEIYHIIGFLITVFMFGLPMGAHTANRLTAEHPPHRRLPSLHFNTQAAVMWLIIIIQTVLALFAFLLPHTMNWFGNSPFWDQAFIFSGTMLVGFAVGMTFPLALRLTMAGHGKPEKAAGIVDAMDHMGAAAGAFFVGALFLPVMGIHRVCILIALFPLLSALLMLSDILRKTGTTPNRKPI